MIASRLHLFSEGIRTDRGAGRPEPRRDPLRAEALNRAGEARFGTRPGFGGDGEHASEPGPPGTGSLSSSKGTARFDRLSEPTLVP